MKKMAVMSLLGLTMLSSLVGCGTEKAVNGAIATGTEQVEQVVEETEQVVDEVATVIEEGFKIKLSSEQVTGDLKPLEYYEQYFHYNNEYREKGDKLVEQYMTEGMTEEEACKQAISDLVDITWIESNEFITKYMMDEDMNGIYDAVEKGEISQEEVDNYLDKWFASTEKQVTDYYASYVRSGDMTVEEAEQHINEFFNE